MRWCRTRREERDFSVHIQHELLVSEGELQHNAKWWIEWEGPGHRREWYGMPDGAVVKLVRQSTFNSFCIEYDSAEAIKDLYRMFAEMWVARQREKSPMLPKIRYGGELPTVLEDMLKRLGAVRRG